MKKTLLFDFYSIIPEYQGQSSGDTSELPTKSDLKTLIV